LGGLIDPKIRSHILKDFYGFELLITPYVIAHLKLTSILKSWFYEFKQDDRVQVYLTNTLDPFETHGHVPFFRELTEESVTADELKQQTPILVILGNPPYAVSSSNKSRWITEKMQDYKENLREKNIQPLNDDYIKFIRFAQWKIDQNNKGIAGLITNNNYLDGKIYRQMRRRLWESFDRIYIVNLHGDVRKRDRSPDGTKDENVFDITKGNAIALFIKNGAYEDKKIFYKDVFGLRETKFQWLDRNSRWLKNTSRKIGWCEVTPTEPNFFFVPKDVSLEQEYDKFIGITEIFNAYSSGVQTHRDHFVVGFTEEELENRLSLFQSKNDDEYVKNSLSLKSTESWSLPDARNSFKNTDFKSCVTDYAYRPFDTRLICYSDVLIDRPRSDFMRSFSKPNIGLVARRNCRTKWRDAFVTAHITDGNFFDARTYVFPLYVESPSSVTQSDRRRINFTAEFAEFTKNQYPNKNITAEEILGYIYTILHSPTYRDLFEEQLKNDFPRISFVKDYQLFKNMSGIGLQLIELHLMKVRLNTTTAFNEQGSNVVGSIKYKNGRAYINSAQFFAGIPEDVWEFYVGGYQVLDKWLKSRKGRELSSSDIEHFLQVVEVIKKTIEYMKEIDGLHAI
jgi:predicted helicase